MTWWQMMKIVWWGSLGWALCLGVVVVVWTIIAEITRGKEQANLKALQDERDRHIEPTNGGRNGNN